MVPDSTGNAQQDIQRLASAQQQPSTLMNFQKVMQTFSRQAYNERQSSEMKQLGTQFDPSKVSGGTFAAILGNLEANRGADISKTYASTMNTYQTIQQEITRRLETLKEAEEDKRRWEAELKLRKKELKRLEKQDKEAAKIAKAKLKMDQEAHAMSMAKALKSGSSSSNDYYSNLLNGFKQITIGNDNYMDPNEFNAWYRDALSNATASKDLQSLSTLVTRAKSLFNPSDSGYYGTGEDTSGSGWGD
jgi:hypothetical protein